MHGPLQHRAWSFGVHEIENAMDHLVAPDAENGSGEAHRACRSWQPAAKVPAEKLMSTGLGLGRFCRIVSNYLREAGRVGMTKGSPSCFATIYRDLACFIPVSTQHRVTNTDSKPGSSRLMESVMKLSRILVLTSLVLITPNGARAQVAGSTLIGVAQAELRDVALGWSAKRQVLGQPVFNDQNE